MKKYYDVKFFDKKVFISDTYRMKIKKRNMTKTVYWRNTKKVSYEFTVLLLLYYTAWLLAFQKKNFLGGDNHELAHVNVEFYT